MAEAEPLTTPMEWDDLVLDAEARHQVEDIAAWEQHAMVLFVGGGETARNAAALIAKKKGCTARRVDLAKAVGKQVADTKKTLEPIFEQAAREGWLLYLDGIEAALAPRGGGGGQQRAYLLQRIQDYPGIVIIATNLRSIMDESFARRFLAVVQFSKPTAAKTG